MTKRTLFVAVLATALTVFTAGPAFAAHCVNLSKEPGAGNHTDVLLTPGPGMTVTDVEFLGGNGGFADVYVDLDFDGMPDSNELMEEDIMIGRNHSPQWDALVEAWINPGAENKMFGDNEATTSQGMGFHEEPTS